MHDSFMTDLARSTNAERLRAADQQRLTRAARKSRRLRSATIGSRVRAAFRIGPFAEPVRPAPPRARFLVRQAPARETESGMWVA